MTSPLADVAPQAIEAGRASPDCAIVENLEPAGAFLGWYEARLDGPIQPLRRRRVDNGLPIATDMRLSSTLEGVDALYRFSEPGRIQLRAYRKRFGCWPLA